MGSWRALQARLSKGGIKQDKLADYLCEYLWRYTINELAPRIHVAPYFAWKVYA